MISRGRSKTVGEAGEGRDSRRFAEAKEEIQPASEFERDSANVAELKRLERRTIRRRNSIARVHEKKEEAKRKGITDDGETRFMRVVSEPRVSGSRRVHAGRGAKNRKARKTGV